MNHYTQDGRPLDVLSDEELNVCVRKYLNTDPALAKAAKKELERRKSPSSTGVSSAGKGKRGLKLEEGKTYTEEGVTVTEVRLVDVDVPFMSVLKTCFKVFMAFTLISICMWAIYTILIVVILGGLFGALTAGG